MPTPPTNSGSNLRHLLEAASSCFPRTRRYRTIFRRRRWKTPRRRIKRAIDRGDGPALVVGGAGTGKSLLLQVLAAQYHKRYDVVLLACARICTRRALLQTILFELGLPYQHRDEGQLRLSLLDHLLSDNQCPTGLLLLVDEAQSLSTTLLDELRVMTNLMRGGSPRVRVVLAGSAALEESFADPELESFSQRLSARCYLAPLSREETSQFVCAQIAAAGAAPESVFAPDACDAVFDATDGVPRLVNQVCDRALLLACDENRTLVDRHMIQAAWADLQQLPTTWARRGVGRTRRRDVTSDRVRQSRANRPSNSSRQLIVEPTELDADEELPSVDKPASANAFRACPAIRPIRLPSSLTKRKWSSTASPRGTTCSTPKRRAWKIAATTVCRRWFKPRSNAPPVVKHRIAPPIDRPRPRC